MNTFVRVLIAACLVVGCGNKEEPQPAPKGSAELALLACASGQCDDGLECVHLRDGRDVCAGRSCEYSADCADEFVCREARCVRVAPGSGGECPAGTVGGVVACGSGYEAHVASRTPICSLCDVARPDGAGRDGGSRDSGLRTDGGREAGLLDASGGGHVRDASPDAYVDGGGTSLPDAHQGGGTTDATPHDATASDGGPARGPLPGDEISVVFGGAVTTITARVLQASYRAGCVSVTSDTTACQSQPVSERGPNEIVVGFPTGAPITCVYDPYNDYCGSPPVSIAATFGAGDAIAVSDGTGAAPTSVHAPTVCDSFPRLGTPDGLRTTVSAQDGTFDAIRIRARYYEWTLIRDVPAAAMTLVGADRVTPIFDDAVIDLLPDSELLGGIEIATVNRAVDSHLFNPTAVTVNVGCGTEVSRDRLLPSPDDVDCASLPHRFGQPGLGGQATLTVDPDGRCHVRAALYLGASDAFTAWRWSNPSTALSPQWQMPYSTWGIDPNRDFVDFGPQRVVVQRRTDHARYAIDFEIVRFEGIDVTSVTPFDTGVLPISTPGTFDCFDTPRVYTGATTVICDDATTGACEVRPAVSPSTPRVCARPDGQLDAAPALFESGTVLAGTFLAWSHGTVVTDTLDFKRLNGPLPLDTDISVTFASINGPWTIVFQERSSGGVLIQSMSR